MESYAALYEVAGEEARGRKGPTLQEEREERAGGAGRGDQRIRVGFISANFRDQTVGVWTEGLIEQFDREKFHVIVLSIGRHEDDTGRRIRAKADEYAELSSHLPAARRAVAEAKLDVLLYADIGMEGFAYTLAMSRLAPVQCVTWGHPITSGLNTVDYFISSELAEAEDAQKNYTEKLVRLKNLPLYYHRPPPPKVKRDRPYFDLPDEAHVYGCLQTVFKLHPAFDEAIGGILRADPKGLLVVPKPGTANWGDVTLGRLRAAYPDVVDRIRLVRRLERDEFRALNAACDVMLAPFPFGAGDTSMEAFAAGVPVVTMPTPFLKGRLTHAMYRWMGIEDCVASSPAEYARLAVKLGRDRAWRGAVREKILARNGVLYENVAGVRELEAFFETFRLPVPGTPGRGY
jgi:protein O-GlcNAc transferase